MGQKIGIFGGAFNPPHISHLWIAVMALEFLEIDKLILIPCYKHQFAKDMIPFEHRINMTKLLVAHLKGVEVSDIEKKVGGDGKTLITLKALKELYPPNTSFYLIIGADNWKLKENWYKFDEIEKLATIIIVKRKGVETDIFHLPEPPGISSTELREKIKQGEDLSLFIPKAVYNYIKENRLYI